ncbi:LysM peptidoglycan-binding domain-containing protein [bacterium]|nr:LysM peptidoglycan-binding domain-containing protein [bacterium]
MPTMLRNLSTLLFTALFLASCGTMKSRTASKATPPASDHTGTATEIPDTLPAPEAEAADSRRMAEIENYSIGEVLRIEEPNTTALYDNSRYDFPITMNSRVEGWIDYFTGRGRPHMERYLARSGRYIPVMKQILKREGLPEDLVYLALIESGFNLRARSRAKAVGAWQFIKGTGRRYGLRIDGWIDERHDPIRSTEAAASYLRDLYLMFESWYLAAAAYNAGEYKILRSIQSTKSNNFWTIAQTTHLRRETKDYVPKLIAAAIIAKNPEKYGFEDITYLDPLEYETVQVGFPLSMKKVSELVDAPEDELHDLNPHFIRGMVPVSSTPFEVRVPVGSRALVERAVTAMRANLVPAQMDKEYAVRRGDTLATVARKHKIRKTDLASANNLSSREKLQPGMTLIIPHGAAKVVFTEPKGDATEHKVQPGESLWSIAEQYDVTVGDLFEWNDLENAKIYPGRKIQILGKTAAGPAAPKKAPPVRTAAAVESGFLEHEVKEGDTLWSIASKYNVSVRQLHRWNGLRRSRIIPGDVLKVKAERGSRANQAKTSSTNA